MAIHYIDGFARTLAMPSSMFVYLSLSGFAERAATLRVRARSSAVRIKAPELQFESVVAAGEMIKVGIALRLLRSQGGIKKMSPVVPRGPRREARGHKDQIRMTMKAATGVRRVTLEP